MGLFLCLWIVNLIDGVNRRIVFFELDLGGKATYIDHPSERISSFAENSVIGIGGSYVEDCEFLFEAWVCSTRVHSHTVCNSGWHGIWYFSFCLSLSK